MKRTPATSPRSLALLLAMLLPGCKSDIDPAQLDNLRDDLDAVVSGTRGAPPREDTNRDGWNTEVFSARAQGTLKALTLLLESPPGKGPETGLLADDFQCSTLRPEELEETFRDRHSRDVPDWRVPSASCSPPLKDQATATASSSSSM